MIRIENKGAIIIDGAHGIGKVICRLLAIEGAKKAVTDILDKDGQWLVNESENPV